VKITFLGTSHGVPEKDRFCSATMIEIQGNAYFIDAGAPIASLIRRYDKSFEAVKAIFTTHAHGDHIGGLISFVDLANWFFNKTSVDIYMTESAPVNAINAYIEAVGQVLDTERIRFNVIDEGFVYQDENIKVTAFPTEHLNRNAQKRPSYGYIVEADGKKVVFSGDLSIHLKHGDFPKAVLEEEVDLFICEMAHFNIADITPYLEKCKAKKLLFNHIGYMESFESIEALNEKYSYPISIVKDGDQIEI
jgi:ribonuclease BN (tRNA processing enzyme)